ncbi:beta-1,3-glucanase family protein [Flavivirga jejuensis]|uniref:Beta-1,3-glucanase family protein n=1 Tax=Flavivirga jejuensis TaxID=870487 RepID=A0ABT8WIR8_9FLAO|nr:beta-1,3-glucanase family protein [Flavivirga jejuensis]MDO5973048.1 beta-1,3-glucanase family protein [Flavivirga jejuensis]
MKKINTKHLHKTIQFILISSFILISITKLNAQTFPLPYEIVNSSTYEDSEIYVGLVGKINDGEDVWMDLSTSTINPMLVTDNTIDGPSYNGNNGPGNNAKYADCFTKLSDIPNKTIQIPQIYAVRIFIAFEEQLYLYFFGGNGGYSAPAISNDSDPNQNIRYEMIELTYGDNGLWTNTTRVDAYQYPMGLEVWGEDGFYKKVGELKTHQEILDEWTARVPDAFLACLNTDLGIIEAPSKTSEFQEGGAYSDYFGTYVDAVWAKYRNEDLNLSIGEAGFWIGSVNSDNEFIFTNANGVVGMISDKPTTPEILEAKGVLAEDVSSTPDIHADKNIQKHFSAAFNRGVIDINADNGEIIEWSNEDEFFTNDPFNEYVKFWHSTDISFEGETYAFAYDDVFDFSSTIQSTVPSNVRITIGGFSNVNNETNYTSIPSLIEAESFISQSGTQSEASHDTDNGTSIGWIDSGDYLIYNINVPSSGTYSIDFRIASISQGVEFDIYQGMSLIGSMSSPATGGWFAWETVSVDVNLTEGNQTLKLLATGSGWNINWLDITSSTNTTPPPCTAGTNLSLNATIVDFSTQENTTNTVLNIIDGNDTNRWSASGFPQYAVIDLGDNYNVNEINLATYNDRDYQFTVEGSTTSASSGFSTLVDASNNTSSSPINKTFSTQEVRYVKLTITGANSYTGTWVAIADFEIICAGTSTAKTDTKKIVSNSPAVLEFKTYPNPFSNTINITTDTNDTIILKLVDLVGKTIREKTINSNASLDNLDNLAKGLYLLQIINTNTQTVKTQKFIKN